MGIAVTTFSKFKPSEYDRYTFDAAAHVVHDSKFSRDIVPKVKRGGQPYFRLVTAAGPTNHVLAKDIFGEVHNLPANSDFAPADYADRYDFDFKKGSVKRLPGRGPSSGSAMTLLSPHGWDHYYLTRNDGHRIKVTPAEIKEYAVDRTAWVVDVPKGGRVVGQFPCHAFMPNGTVVKIISANPLIRPKTVHPEKHPEDWVYPLKSEMGTMHRFTRTAIKQLFKI